ncbi:formimidoylglutamase [Patiriisocius marinus]|uniref:Arginase n=1 Tax=Patiriisocius marinus TaxID=1397112 RepID=A0A5J4IZN2_9FLAO|nr:formimidoylglutamase [Patiriisocius marinus]GER59021.1 arginase [Patiriisocius marinus]
MNHLITYSQKTLAEYTNLRDLELKFGEVAATLEANTLLKNTVQKYVLIGIPEDIGVRANHGISGSSNAWKSCLNVLCNMQENSFTNAKQLLILGEVDCRLEMEEASTLDSKTTDYLEKLGALVSRIDIKVSEVVEAVVSAGKIPIIIGGGHNNSFGNLKGLSLAKGKKVNALNFDAHSDFRPLEHRHSGNGFSYAKQEGYLNNYFIYGLHKQYTSQHQIDRMSQNRVQYSWFDETHISEIKTEEWITNEINDFICISYFGLEIDLDAISAMGSSALSPVGFSVIDCIKFIKKYSANKNCGYIHLCEGAPNREIHPNQVGKVLSYLITSVLTK